MTANKRIKRLAWLQPAVLVGSLLPLGLLVLRWFRDELGANPVAVVLNQLGLMGLVLLMASLSCTPLRLLADWRWPMRLRKTLGLLSFFMIVLHLMVYVFVDHGGAMGRVLDEVQKRPFIAVGALAFLVLLPLALTSSRRALKRLGAGRWRRLHRLAYLAGGLGCLHFYMRTKADIREPLVYVVFFSLSLAIRAFFVFSKRTAKKISAS